MAAKDRLDELVAAYLEQLDSGDGATVEQMLIGHPELAAPFAERLRILEQAGFITGAAGLPAPLPDTRGGIRRLQHLGGFDTSGVTEGGKDLRPMVESDPQSQSDRS